MGVLTPSGPAGNGAPETVVRAYQAFARGEARGRSAAYEALAESVARDPALIEHNSITNGVLSLAHRGHITRDTPIWGIGGAR